MTVPVAPAIGLPLIATVTDCDVVIEDLGSELSEESYDYDSDSNNEK